MRLNDINRELLSANDGWKTMTDPVKTNAAGDYDPNGTNAELIYKDFNYGDYAFKSPAVTQDYNLGMSGGNERGKYYANVGYFNEEGLPLNVFYKGSPSPVTLITRSATGSLPKPASNTPWPTGAISRS